MKSSQRGKYKKFTAFELAGLDFVDHKFVPINVNDSNICLVIHQNNVLDLVEHHFNLHPLIPFGPEGNFLTAEEIWRTAVQEIYLFCHKNNYPELWNYLFFSWYTKNRWNLWARSTNPTIPLGKTNMLVESHWKVIKHDYLYRFNRPRIDYVVFVLCEKVISAQITRLHQLANGRINPYWWENFKRTWKISATEDIAINVDERYYVDINRWICSCPAFLYSHFLVCKHLVQTIGEAPRQLLYSDFNRCTVYPFWSFKWKSGVDVDAHCIISENNLPIGATECANSENENIVLSQEDFQKELRYYESFISHMREEYAAGNHRHVRTLLQGTKRVRTIMEDIEKERRKRRRQPMWKNSKLHTLFLP